MTTLSSQLNTTLLNRAAAALSEASEEDKIAYLERISQSWDNQAAIDYMAKALLGT